MAGPAALMSFIGNAIDPPIFSLHSQRAKKPFGCAIVLRAQSRLPAYACRQFPFAAVNTSQPFTAQR